MDIIASEPIQRFKKGNAFVEMAPQDANLHQECKCGLTIVQPPR